MKKLFNCRTLIKILGAVVGIVSISASSFGPSTLHAQRLHRTLLVDGERRRYLMYVPAGYDTNKAVPLVISIHGFAGWPGNQEQISGWDKLADRYGFIVIYPQGTSFPLRWRANGTEDSYKDIDFIQAILDSVENGYNIDPARIYVDGHSNGGGMSFLLTCTLADRFAAAGGVAGAYLYPWNKCQNTRPVPFIAFHGTADPVVPYTGGPSHEFDLPFKDVRTWVGEYAAHNGCTGNPETSEISPVVTRTLYSNCGAGMEVALYSIEGSGHGWPGHGADLPAFIVGPTNNSIDATEIMWQFFNDHPLNK